MIPCKRGHIFPWGASTLAASTNGQGPTTKRLMTLPGVTVHQDGSDGATVLFPVDRFDAVAELMLPKRRRVVSETELERLRAIGFQKAPLAHVEVENTSAVCVQTV